MLLPEALADSISVYGSNALKIYCEDKIREEVSFRFTEVFDEKYHALLKKSLHFQSDEEFEEYLDGDDGAREEDGNYNPHETVAVTDYGVYITFDHRFTIHTTWGEYIIGDAAHLIPETMKILANEFGKIDYEYYIGYQAVDTHGGEVGQYEFSTLEQDLETKTYDHVGKAINEFIKAGKIEGRFWKVPDEYEEYDSEEIAEEAVETVKALLAYSSYLDKGAVEQFIKSYFIAISSEASDPEELDGAEIMLEFIDYSNAQGYTDVTAALMDILDRNRAEFEQMFTL